MVQGLEKTVAVLDTKHNATEKQGIENRANIGQIFRRLTVVEVRMSLIFAVITLAAKYLLP